MGREKIEKFFDKYAKDRGRWLRRDKYYHNEIERLLWFLLGKEGSILEIGCGTGDTLKRFPNKERYGIDISREMVEIASKNPGGIKFIKGSAEDFKMNKKVDFIFMIDTVNLLEDVQKSFENLRKNCKPETRVIITFHNALWEPILKLAEKVGLKMKMPLQNWLGADDVENLLELADFQVVKKGQRILIPEYIPLISTFFNKFISQLPLIRKLCLINYVVARPRELRQKKEYTCSVIIPARNEEGNIERAIKEMPRIVSDMEVIFVEGGSTDNTYQEIKRVAKKYGNKWKIRYMKQGGKGKGDAVRKGYDAAKGDILMILDADLTVPPKDLAKFYNAMKTDQGEFINGCRLVYPMDKEAMRTLNKIGNKFFGLMFTWLLDQRFKDTLCGTKVIYKKDYEKLKRNRAYFGEFDPFGDFDLIFGASKMNLKIVEVPIRYKERTYGETNISRFRHGWILLKMCFFAMRKIKFF
ncbi:glycosyltransferase [Candidatus Pacearchaeota archaeon]|nr:glycosyltransferase [Candidatus Pacearchaeota archaeon]